MESLLTGSAEEAIRRTLAERKAREIVGGAFGEAYVPDPDIAPYAVGLREPARYKVLYGGRGAARSWSVARELLVRSARKTTRVLCARELQRSIKDSVHRLLKDQIERLELKGFTVLETEIRHANGSIFRFMGLRHNATAVKSFEGVDICWIEEAEGVSEDSWKYLTPTIRKPGSEIWITFNPDLETDPTYQRYVVRNPPDTFRIHATWRDNPWFGETELAAEKDWLYEVDPEAAEWVWGGQCRQATDAQILRGKWFVEDFEVGEDWDGPYQGLDWGFAQDPTAAVRCWIHERTLYVSHEAWKIGLDLDETGAFVCSEIPGFERYTIRADNARPESISHVSKRDRSTPLPRITAVKKWQGSVEDGIAHLRQYERIVVHPRCVRFKDECRLYSYKTDRLSGDVLPKIVDAHNHLIDATRYALEPMIRRKTRVLAWYPGMEEVA